MFSGHDYSRLLLKFHRPSPADIFYSFTFYLTVIFIEGEKNLQSNNMVKGFKYSPGLTTSHGSTTVSLVTTLNLLPWEPNVGNGSGSGFCAVLLGEANPVSK